MLHPYRDLHPLGWAVAASLAAVALVGLVGLTFR